MSRSPEEREEFKIAALELLKEAEASLRLAATCSANFECVFRTFRKLKGAAGLMEFTEIQDHAREFETVLKSIQSQASIPENYVSLILEGIAATRLLLGEVPTLIQMTPITKEELLSNPTTEAASEIWSEPTIADSSIDSGIQEFLNECKAIIARTTQELSSTPLEMMAESLSREFQTLKGNAFLFDCEIIAQIAHLVESSIEPLRKGTHLASDSLLPALLKSLDFIQFEIVRIETNADIEKSKELFRFLARVMASIVRKLERIPPELIPSPPSPEKLAVVYEPWAEKKIS